MSDTQQQQQQQQQQHTTNNKARTKKRQGHTDAKPQQHQRNQRGERHGGGRLSGCWKEKRIALAVGGRER